MSHFIGNAKKKEDADKVKETEMGGEGDSRNDEVSQSPRRSVLRKLKRRLYGLHESLRHGGRKNFLSLHTPISQDW